MDGKEKVLNYALSQAVKFEAVKTAAEPPAKLLVVSTMEHDCHGPSTAGLRDPWYWLLQNIDIYKTMWHNNQVDLTLDTHCCENLISPLYYLILIVAIFFERERTTAKMLQLKPAQEMRTYNITVTLLPLR